MSAKKQKCRVCGCTEQDCKGCIERTGEACHWVEPDLCSACTGVTMICLERVRQVEQEGWSAEHDATHTAGELAMAAACYAAPERIYREERRFVNRVDYIEPWPFEGKFDNRFHMGERRKNRGNALPAPSTLTDSERIQLLVKAGALIAAEIDRLTRKKGGRQ